ncbi:MAG: acyl carrier protein [Planctomycetota bacterium]|nr:MAG: acyl carrier protein [Planctomycetota bacterium]
MNEQQNLLAQRIIEGLNLEDITVEDVDIDTPLFGEGLGLDSIDALELAVIVDRNYGVKINNAEEGRSAFASIRSLDSYIQQHCADATP